MDVTGVGCNIGDFAGLDALEAAIYWGRLAQAPGRDRANRQDGHAADLLAVAGQALSDAGYALSAGRRGHSVAVVMAAEPGQGEAVCSRWRLNGPVIDVSAGDVGAEISAAQRLLSGAWPALSSVLICDGTAAVVLSRPRTQAPEGNETRMGTQRPVYATISAASSAGPASVGERDPVGWRALASPSQDALAAAGLAPDQVEYIDLMLPGSPDDNEPRIGELTRVWSAERLGACHTAIGWSSAPGERDLRPSLLPGLIKSALCLHHCYLPVWDGPEWAEKPLLDRSAFYLAGASRPWIRPAPCEPLHAMVSVVGADGSQAHLVLSGATIRADVVRVDWTRAGGPALLPFGGLTAEDLARQVTQALDEPAKTAAGGQFLGQPGQAGVADLPVRAVFCAHDAVAMRRELRAALGRLSAGSGMSLAWETPAGSCYCPAPIGRDGRVALVFPGIFTAYPGLGTDLFRCFPGLIHLIEANGNGERERELSRAGWLYPRRCSASDGNNPSSPEVELFENPSVVAEVCTSYAVAQTQILREVLGLTVHGAIGYSLGEISMACALGQRGPFTASMSASADDLFREWLGGPKTAVRELWKLPDRTPDKAVWATRMLFADPASVREQVLRHDLVFLTQVNTHREVIIAGDPDQCRAVARALDCPSMPSRLSYVLHCPVPDAPRLAARLQRQMPAVSHPTDGVELFSTRTYDRIADFDADGLAEHIAETLRAVVDFPRIVEVMYQRGYRYFIEVGPGRTCTRWIDEILGNRTHVAISVDRRGAGTAAGIARVLSRLAANGLPVALPGTGTNRE
jgi:PfaB family protein